MYYLYDHSHSSIGEEFEEALIKVLSGLDRAEIFVENVSFSGEEKKIKDRIWNNWLREAAEVEDGRLYDSSNSISLSRKDLVIAEATYKTRENIARMDTGPVFDEELEEESRKIRKAQSTDMEVDVNFLANYIAKRDVKTARYISNRCQNPDETVVTMGSYHNLDRLLETGFSVKFPVNIPRLNPRDRKGKELALGILKNNGHL